MDWLPIEFFAGIYQSVKVAVLIEDGHIVRTFADNGGDAYGRA